MRKNDFNAGFFNECLENKAQEKGLLAIHIKYKIRQEMKVTKQTLSLWCNKRVLPNIEHLEFLSKYFNEDINKFLLPIENKKQK